MGNDLVPVKIKFLTVADGYKVIISNKLTDLGSYLDNIEDPSKVQYLSIKNNRPEYIVLIDFPINTYFPNLENLYYLTNLMLKILAI